MFVVSLCFCLFSCCQILIEGTVGDDFRGDIAVDDLSFLDCEAIDGKCYTPIHTRQTLFCVCKFLCCLFTLFCCFPGELPSPITPAMTTPAPTALPHSCSEGEFVCGAYGECVDLSQVCDFKHDCSDGSDESNCGKTFSRARFQYFHQNVLVIHHSSPPLSSSTLLFCLSTSFSKGNM